MKKLMILLVVLVLLLPVSAQEHNTKSNVTINPRIDQPYPADMLGTTHIDNVVITTDNTFVTFTYTAGNINGGYIALSSKTYMVVDGQIYTIESWAEDTDPINELAFDTHLMVQSNTQYRFVMAFPHLPAGVDVISIIEPNGFYWKGIHINNQTAISEVNNAEISSHYTELVGTTFRVTNNTTNGENRDQLSLSYDHVIHFYVNNNGELSFSNHWRAIDSQSYGPIYSMKVSDVPETARNYAYTDYKFTWNYFNTYDDKHGSAVVTFNVIHIGDVKKFSCQIIVMETNMILEYKGYLE